MKPLFHQRIAPLAAAILLAFSGSVYAANDSGPVDSKQKIEQEERTRKEEAAKRTDHIFTLLFGEIALTENRLSESLGSYVNVYNRSQSPEVAERIMEISTQVRAYNVAETIYQKWRASEPNPSPALRRWGWVRAISNNQLDVAMADMKQVFAEANSDEQRSKLLAILAEYALQSPNKAEGISSQVIQLAREYSDLPESALVEVIYNGNKGAQVMSALKRLATLDKDISPTTMRILFHELNKNPDLLTTFFKKTDSSKLAPIWRELEVENLIASGQYDAAEQKIQKLLNEETKSANVYFQAARLHMYQGADIDIVAKYYQQAYEHGNDDDKARAAINMSVQYASMSDWRNAEDWAQRITHSHYLFDKWSLLTMIADKQQNWQKTYEYSKEAFKHPTYSDSIFSILDLQGAYLRSMSQVLPQKKLLAELNAHMANLEKSQQSVLKTELLMIALEFRANLYSLMSQPEKGIADLRKLLALDPDNAMFKNNLGYVLLESKPSKYMNEALPLIQAAYDAEPNNVMYNDSLGWAYYKKGQAQMALPYLEFAYDNLENAEVASHLGEVYWALKQPEKAKEIWQKAWIQSPKDKYLLNTLKRFKVQFK
ncbi:hypothetical protein QEO94_04765 [Kingella negevensis]|uniref:tetratricopeptide repeat protein n=1 Tax=Kingella negevensis TaxID=1522312 RepID=UPI0025432432|nr:hypothetical protein [Kingella negevensis]WII94103.1 hypothetical protein QEO94_04765 [Kingella negevensis]